MELMIVLPILISFAISAGIGPFVIKEMRRLKAAQTERTEGVESHLKKAGTPTMGGLMILAGIIITSLIFLRGRKEILPVLFLTVSFGVIGFLDDYLKVVLRRSDGLLPRQKLILQFGATIVFWLILRGLGISLELMLPFGGGRLYDIGWFAVPLMFIAVLATVNGVNFTDGLDGLASSVTIFVALFFMIAAIRMHSGVSPAAGAVIGGLMGFLLYNAYPAKIFMGDTGSLALGGFVAGIAYVLHMPLFILIVGFIYAMELISVVLQVSYFKLTHGKRIFKMTPIHHHFELCDWSETRIVTTFTIITVILAMVGMIHAI
ncbi:MAG: phospho-N-acetylmuramoyl-pentapeptide-transferase [Eubacterium sp.]|nr:phospho-N-acetylmuramoyl-pentapeptide-transferase [Eubacterium sp.]